jgi:hypothetical protein
MERYLNTGPAAEVLVSRQAPRGPGHTNCHLDIERCNLTPYGTLQPTAGRRTDCGKLALAEADEEGFGASESSLDCWHSHRNT